MPPCKNIIRNTLGYLILALSTTAASHLVPSSEITTGKKIYHDRCEVCHGSQGNGKTFAANALFPSPKNFTAIAVKKQLHRERMIRSVTKGRPGTAMMPWESVLNKHEIYLVVDYIRKALMRLQE